MAELAPGPLGSDLLGVHPRLQACAQLDPAHVQPGAPRSDFLAAIQEALRQVDGAIITETNYGPQTIKAVVKFKTDKNIFTRGTRSIDPIVGINTIAMLDNLMQDIEGKGRRREQPPIVKTQDIYVKIFGYDRPDQQGQQSASQVDNGHAYARQIETATYTERHYPLCTIWITGGEKPNPTEQIVSQINSLKAMPLGRVLICGGSAGGRNVLEVAGALKDVPITYLAIWDGAFQKADLVDPGTFDNDANFNPDSPATLRLKPPQLGSLGVGAPFAIKESWFQSFGHCLDKNQEIHGEMTGFLNHDLTRHGEVTKVKKKYDDTWVKTGTVKQKALSDAHVAAYLTAMMRSEAKVTAILGVRPLA